MGYFFFALESHFPVVYYEYLNNLKANINELQNSSYLKHSNKEYSFCSIFRIEDSEIIELIYYYFFC